MLFCFFRSFSFVRPFLPDEDTTKLGNKSGSYLSHSHFHGQSDLHAVPRRGLHRGVRNRLLLHTLHLYDRQRHCTVGSAHYQLQFRFGIPRKGSANRKNSPTDFRILRRIRHRRIHSLLPNTDKNIHRPAQPCRPTGHSGFPALYHGLPLLHPQPHHHQVLPKRTAHQARDPAGPGTGLFLPDPVIHLPASRPGNRKNLAAHFQMKLIGHTLTMKS